MYILEKTAFVGHGKDSGDVYVTHSPSPVSLHTYAIVSQGHKCMVNGNGEPMFMIFTHR